MNDIVIRWLLWAIDAHEANDDNRAISCLKTAKERIEGGIVEYGDAIIEIENVAEELGLLKAAFGRRHVPVGNALWAQYYNATGF